MIHPKVSHLSWSLGCKIRRVFKLFEVIPVKFNKLYIGTFLLFIPSSIFCLRQIRDLLISQSFFLSSSTWLKLFFRSSFLVVRFWSVITFIWSLTRSPLSSISSLFINLFGIYRTVSNWILSPWVCILVRT